MTVAIRPPVVHAEFDEHVWALIRADEAEALALRSTWGTRLGIPWWLGALNIVAIAVTAVAVTIALRGLVTVDVEGGMCACTTPECMDQFVLDNWGCGLCVDVQCADGSHAGGCVFCD